MLIYIKWQQQKSNSFNAKHYTILKNICIFHTLLHLKNSKTTPRILVNRMTLITKIIKEWGMTCPLRDFYELSLIENSVAFSVSLLVKCCDRVAHNFSISVNIALAIFHFNQCGVMD